MCNIHVYIYIYIYISRATDAARLCQGHGADRGGPALRPASEGLREGFECCSIFSDDQTPFLGTPLVSLKVSPDCCHSHGVWRAISFRRSGLSVVEGSRQLNRIVGSLEGFKEARDPSRTPVTLLV